MGSPFIGQIVKVGEVTANDKSNDNDWDLW